MRIYYVIPDAFKRSFLPRKLLQDARRGDLFKHFQWHWWPKEKPIGGVKVSLQHCLLLREMGFDVYPLCMGRYRGDFFGFDLEYLDYNQIKRQITDSDILVFPEYLANMHSKFPVGVKVIFVQNWMFIYKPSDGDELTDTTYANLGYDHIICCGDYMYDCLKPEDQMITHMVKNYIDHDRFTAGSFRQEYRLLAMPRKNKKDLDAIIGKITKRGWDIVFADNLSESELIKEYQKADVFLATGYPEGFGLPPIEAMACGCAVVGFTGRGANEFMIHEKTALVAEDGDTDMAASLLDRLFDDKGLKERLRECGQEAAKRYNKGVTVEQLKKTFDDIGGRI